MPLIRALLLLLCLGAAQAAPSLDALVGQLKPQLAFYFDGLAQQGRSYQLDGVRALRSSDKFLPGKVALGMAYVLLDTPANDARLPERLSAYRRVTELQIADDNDTWGMYYQLLALDKLRRAGLLERALDAPLLERLRKKLDWRHFVREQELTLIGTLPANYYGVAFSVARLRLQLGWEDASGGERLLAKTMEHYRRYSGSYGFSDETDGEGRFDRYSILLIAEICSRFVETDLPVTDELKGLLRRAATVAFKLINAEGDGFQFGRSIGAYGDTAMQEIFAIAAHLGVLSEDEKRYAYAFAVRSVQKYLGFWYDTRTGSVNLWDGGRRTDAYRGKHRVLGENLSLIHQMRATASLWQRAGFANQAPVADLASWLKRTQPRFSVDWFARGDYDRALVTWRDAGQAFALLLVNGGATQHDNAPYYPLPFSKQRIEGVPDSGAGHPQLLPSFVLSDGTQLLPTSFIQDLRVDEATRQVSFRLPGLNRVGERAPVLDARIRVQTRYQFAAGRITRTDTFTPAEPMQVRSLSWQFQSFSRGARALGDGRFSFQQGAVHRAELKGLANCRAEALSDDARFQAAMGPMRSRLLCSTGPFLFDRPLTVSWTLHHR